jgi:hypothetical protein
VKEYIETTMCDFYDDESGVCCNPDCPMVADFCPVPDTRGVCQHEKFEIDDDAVFKLTPKGCATIALKEAGLIKGIMDPAADLFFDKFQELMKQCGYIEEES